MGPGPVGPLILSVHVVFPDLVASVTGKRRGEAVLISLFTTNKSNQRIRSLLKRNRHKYFLRVARSLAACQKVELELKLYITQALELVKKCVAQRMPFEMAGTDYKNASLERLIETFKKLSNNPALTKKLEEFKEKRNFVAHKAIAACLDMDGDLIEPVAATLECRLAAIEREAACLTEAIYQEAAKFISHIYFDSNVTK